MKVYFTAAISQINEFGGMYKRIAKLIKDKGHELESGNLFSMTKTSIVVTDEKTRLEWYNQSMKNITKSDMIVVEISMPSTVNVGHELSVALDKGLPVLALYREDRDPIFLRGTKNDKLQVVSYNATNLEAVLSAGIDYASEQMDSRFNFFVSPKIVNYLDWVSKKRRLPRAVYLRKLIEKDMEKHEPEK